MDDIRIGVLNHDVFAFPLKGVEGETDRGGMDVHVGLSVLHFYSPQVGLPVIAGGCGCRGSTTLAPHTRCSLCSFYSRQPAKPASPNNVFKAVFFTV